MADIRITCVRKTGKTHDTITHVGSRITTALDLYSSPWPKQMVVEWIDKGVHRFFTEEGGKRAVVTTQGNAPNKYLQTKSDNVLTNNLIELPHCP